MLTKEDILEEIRKTAKDNSGIPLGSSRFEKETGIKPYYWKKYWARLGDAQLEAGFKPNTLNSAFSDEHLLEKFIALTRELKKLPTAGELNVKHSSDRSFPGSKAFYRLGNVKQLVSGLLTYANDKNYEDIVKLCKAYLEEKVVSEEAEADDLRTEIGSVYLVKSGHFYKIGRTNNMDRRHQEITIILPEGLVLIHEIKTDDPSGIENYWHRRFESKRKNGEWFDLNSSDVKAFKRWRRII